jgi:lysophospholipase L1-like esterase
MKKRNVFGLVIFGISILLNVFFGIHHFYYQEKRFTNENVIADHHTEESFKDLVFENGLNYSIKGRFHNVRNFNRLPDEYKNMVRKEVWDLGLHSAGLSVHFSTNSPVVAVRWKVGKNSSPMNMSRLGSSGVDLYKYDNGKWQYAASGLPSGSSCESILISGRDKSFKTFALNLPLFDQVRSVEIGIAAGCKIKKETGVVDSLKKPIVFYGTSITQGAGVSRPGMAYPSIISRNLSCEVINLGFSGNGLFESSIGNILCGIDAELIVIDCTPNSGPDVIRNNALLLLNQIRACRPSVPVLLVESVIRENAYFRDPEDNSFGSLNFILQQNATLKGIYNDALKSGMKHLYYLSSEDLIGNDHEATVDGTHLSDLGAYRMAGAIGKKLKEILYMKQDTLKKEKQ